MDRMSGKSFEKSIVCLFVCSAIFPVVTYLALSLDFVN